MKIDFKKVCVVIKMRTSFLQIGYRVELNTIDN